MPERHVHRLRVRYRECDQQGVVFNGHYFSWFDDVFTEALRGAGLPYNAIIDAGVDMVVAEASARYRSGARFDDEVDLHWWVTRLGNTGMTTRIDVMREDEILVEGEVRYVFVDAGTTNKRPMPDDIRTKLEPYVSSNG
ncbi:MAG TPA: thioesterase family protein [Thermoleophilaceae bacterium]|nr:thioesterase family protein [Thermoleophilaceae bacterium]